MRWWTAAVAVALMVGVAPGAGADEGSRLVVASARATGTIAVDGRLDEPAWTAAAPAGPFMQRRPDEGRAATEPTELRLLFDEDALYVGARLHDRQAADIVRRLSRRDAAVEADTFTLVLDPQHDHLTGVLLRVSAAGVQQDSLVYNDTFLDPSWDAVWSSAVAIDPAGWTVELRVPFSQLRFQRSDRVVWGVNASRMLHRRNEETWLVVTPSDQSGLASRTAHLVGLEGLSGVRHLELLPYASTRGELIAPAPGDPFNDGARLFAATGLDVKYRLTSSLTFDGSVNPDFGQVEVDPAVVNLQATEVYYEEKRPFFVEGNPTFRAFGRGGASEQYGFFRTEPDLFYSRRIGRTPQGLAGPGFVDRPATTTILGAGKLTGRTAGGWTVGALEAVTAPESVRVANGLGETRVDAEPLTSYSAFRAARELGGRASLGVLSTAVHRRLDPGPLADLLVGQAYVGGIDGHVFVDPRREWVLTGSVAASHLRGTPAAIERVRRAPVRFLNRPDAPHLRPAPGATTFSGWTGHLDLNRNAGRVQVNAAVWGMSPEFDANDLGFMYQADRAGGHVLVQLRKPTPDRFTRSRYLWVSKWWTWNWGPELQGDGVQAQAGLEFRNYWRLGTSANFARRVWDDRLTRGGPSTIRPGNRSFNVNFGTDPRPKLSLSGFATVLARDYGGWSRTTNLSVVYRPADAVSIAAGPSLFAQRNQAQYIRQVGDPTATQTFGTRYVFGELRQREASLATRVNLTLTPRLSVQVYMQPLVSVGDYVNYKELAARNTFDFLRYGIDGGTLAFDPARREYTADADGPGGPAPPFTFARADFNLKSLRLNTILRWEWRPGSTLYFAWTQQRQDSRYPGSFDVGRDVDALFGAPADDVLFVKLTYWLGR